MKESVRDAVRYKKRLEKLEADKNVIDHEMVATKEKLNLTLGHMTESDRSDYEKRIQPND